MKNIFSFERKIIPPIPITKLSINQLLTRFILFVALAALIPLIILTPFPSIAQSDLYIEFIGKGTEMILVIWIFHLTTVENRQIINQQPFQIKKSPILILYLIIDRIVGLLPYILILTLGAINIFDPLISQEINNQTLTTIAGTPTPTLFQYILDGITLLIFAPIGEELLFRGVLFNNLLTRMSSKKAIILTAFIFAAFHFEIGLFLSLLVSGFILTFVYDRYKNITYSILLHMMINAFSFGLEILSHTHP